MSDGPHRSLNMTRSWKLVAERSDKRSYSREEVAESFVGALEKDCRREINPGFIDTAWRIFSDPEPSLFVTKISDQLETLRRQAGPGIGRSVLDQAISGAERGKTGREGLIEAVKNALGDRAAKSMRQIQEHYCRESSNPRADHVRTRMEEGISGPALDGLARRILKAEQKTEKQPTLKQGLDDGVKLK
jgi:hypothetical protein